MSGKAAPVVVDLVRGHITVGDMVFCDLGGYLSAWAYSGADLTPERAYELGAHLMLWAALKDPSVVRKAA